jgi:hypothetical protein
MESSIRIYSHNGKDASREIHLAAFPPTSKANCRRLCDADSEFQQTHGAYFIFHPFPLVVTVFVYCGRVLEGFRGEIGALSSSLNIFEMQETPATRE